MTKSTTVISFWTAFRINPAIGVGQYQPVKDAWFSHKNSVFVLVPMLWIILGLEHQQKGFWPAVLQVCNRDDSGCSQTKCTNSQHVILSHLLVPEHSNGYPPLVCICRWFTHWEWGTISSHGKFWTSDSQMLHCRVFSTHLDSHVQEMGFPWVGDHFQVQVAGKLEPNTCTCQTAEFDTPMAFCPCHWSVRATCSYDHSCCWFLSLLLLLMGPLHRWYLLVNHSKTSLSADSWIRRHYWCLVNPKDTNSNQNIYWLVLCRIVRDYTRWCTFEIVISSYVTKQAEQTKSLIFFVAALGGTWFCIRDCDSELGIPPHLLAS